MAVWPTSLASRATGLHYANARHYDVGLGALPGKDPTPGAPTRRSRCPNLHDNDTPLIYLERNGLTAELVEVPDGHECNQAGIATLAEQIKIMHSSAI